MYVKRYFVICKKSGCRVCLFFWEKTNRIFLSVWLFDSLPIRGTASDVVGIIAETRFMKTVSDRRTVTSARGKIKLGDDHSQKLLLIRHIKCW